MINAYTAANVRGGKCSTLETQVGGRTIHTFELEAWARIFNRSHQSIVLLNSNKMNLSLPKVPISLRSLINKTINLHLLQGH